MTSNKPLRGEKGTLYEGGIRIPAIARWPGRIPKGTVCDTPAITMDVYPTCVELASMMMPENQPCDGVSLVPLFANAAALLDRKTLYWHLPHYHHSTPASAIRQGDWKLIEFYETGKVELYDLNHDVSEANNLADAEPDRAKKLKAALARWQEHVGARMPQPNPDYDPACAGNWANPQRAASNRETQP